MILRGENIATCPAHLRAKFNQGLNQDRGLNGHVQTAGDARALERKLALVLFACRHQAWHFMLGEFNFLAAKLYGGFAEVLHLERNSAVKRKSSVHEGGCVDGWLGC